VNKKERVSVKQLLIYLYNKYLNKSIRFDQLACSLCVFMVYHCESKEIRETSSCRQRDEQKTRLPAYSKRKAPKKKAKQGYDCLAWREEGSKKERSEDRRDHCNF
jgi:hypothetical protein